MSEPPNLTALRMRFEKTSQRRSSAQTGQRMPENSMSIPGKASISPLMTASRSIGPRSDASWWIRRIVVTFLRIPALFWMLLWILLTYCAVSPSSIPMRRSV
ncbi:hypothetical protein DSECCO2_548320 [anaerobic digester metagenome]